jgi:hypothetical protein
MKEVKEVVFEKKTKTRVFLCSVRDVNTVLQTFKV